MLNALLLFLMTVIAVPTIVGSVYAADFTEDFESYTNGTALPTGWTYEYYIIQPKTPEVEEHEIITNAGNNLYRIQLEVIREWPKTGYASTANILSPAMTPDMQPFSLDIHGSNLRGQGGEVDAGASVGYSILYDTDTGLKIISVRTHALNNKDVSFTIAYNGTRMGYNAVLNDFGNSRDNSMRTVTNNAKDLYNSNGLGDYDTDVNSWILALGGSTYTSQTNGRFHGWTGQYDNIHIMSVLPDTEPPVITAPNDFTFEANGPLTSINDATIGFANVTDDSDSDPLVNWYAFTLPTNNGIPLLIHNSSSFPLGAAVVTWTAVDSSNNVAADTQIITVQDTTPPSLTIPSGVSLNATGKLTPLTVNDYGRASAIDFVDHAPVITNDAPALFPIGDTTITWTATDASGNSVSASQTVTLMPSFAPIRDGFENLDDWSLYYRVGEYTPISGPDYETFHNYEMSVNTQQGVPSPSAKISGDGFVSYTAIQRDISLATYSGDGLFIGVDYHVTSWYSISRITNASIDVLNATGDVVYNNWMVSGGTTNTGWQSATHNITDAVAGLDSITVRLALYDYWIANHMQVVHFDNFYIGVEQPPARATSSEQPELTFLQNLSELMTAGDDVAACQMLLDADSQQITDAKSLISSHNRTLTCQ